MKNEPNTIFRLLTLWTASKALGSEIWNLSASFWTTFLKNFCNNFCDDFLVNFLKLLVKQRNGGKCMIDKESQDCVSHKGQLISKANCQALNSSKKRTNEFVFTTMRRVFVRFLEEIEDSKKAFWNYLTFNPWSNCFVCFLEEFEDGKKSFRN